MLTRAAGPRGAPGAVPGEKWCQTGLFWASEELEHCQICAGKAGFPDCLDSFEGALELWGAESLQWWRVIDVGDKMLGNSGVGGGHRTVLCCFLLLWSWSHLADLPWPWLERPWGHVPVLGGFCHPPQ